MIPSGDTWGIERPRVPRRLRPARDRGHRARPADAPRTDRCGPLAARRPARRAPVRRGPPERRRGPRALRGDERHAWQRDDGVAARRGTVVAGAASGPARGRAGAGRCTTPPPVPVPRVGRGPRPQRRSPRPCTASSPRLVERGPPAHTRERRREDPTGRGWWTFALAGARRGPGPSPGSPQGTVRSSVLGGVLVVATIGDGGWWAKVGASGAPGPAMRPLRRLADQHHALSPPRCGPDWGVYGPAGAALSVGVFGRCGRAVGGRPGVRRPRWKLQRDGRGVRHRHRCRDPARAATRAGAAAAAPRQQLRRRWLRWRRLWIFFFFFFFFIAR